MVVFSCLLVPPGLWAVSFPGLPLWGLTVEFFGFLLVLVWGAVTVAWVAAPSLRRGMWPRWLMVMPALMALAVVVFFTSFPLKARFALSRGAFDEAIAADIANADQSGFPMRIGSYDIFLVSEMDGALRLDEVNGEFFDDAGFLYTTRHSPPEGNGAFENPQYVDLGGGWFAFTASW